MFVVAARDTSRRQKMVRGLFVLLSLVAIVTRIQVQAQDLDVVDSCDSSGMADCCLCSGDTCDIPQICVNGSYKHILNRTRECDYKITTSMTTNATVTEAMNTTDTTTQGVLNVANTVVAEITTPVPTAPGEVSVTLCVYTCPGGFYGNKMNMMCTPCETGCTNCTGLGKCTSCVAGFEIEGSICIPITETPLGAIIGGSIACVVFLVVVITTVICICKKRRQNIDMNEHSVKSVEELRTPNSTVNEDIDKDVHHRRPDDDKVDIENEKEPEFDNYENVPRRDKNLTLTIQQSHDKVLRYTPDPTQNIGQSNSTKKTEAQETDEIYMNSHMMVRPQDAVNQNDDRELEKLPIAPKIPAVVRNQKKQADKTRTSKKSADKQLVAMRPKTQKKRVIEEEDNFYDPVGEAGDDTVQSINASDKSDKDYENDVVVKQLKSVKVNSRRYHEQTTPRETAENTIEENYENDDAVTQFNQSRKVKGQRVAISDEGIVLGAEKNYETDEVEKSQMNELSGINDDIYENYVEKRNPMK